MNAPKQYVRPMDGWWLKNPFYVRYMIRESTAVFVGIYAFILLAGLWSLAAGEAAYNNWLAAMTNPVAVLFHVVAFAAAIYHAVTWFAVAPKVMPRLVIGKKKISDAMITITHYVIAVVLYLAMLGIAWRV
jgi:succinate dehydrogenase subunit C